jgi:hypothetical protein
MTASDFAIGFALVGLLVWFFHGAIEHRIRRARERRYVQQWFNGRQRRTYQWRQ